MQDNGGIHRVQTAVRIIARACMCGVQGTEKGTPGIPPVLFSPHLDGPGEGWCYLGAHCDLGFRCSYLE